MPATLPRVSWETKALDGRKVEKTAMYSSSMLNPTSIGKASLSGPSCPDKRVKEKPTKGKSLASSYPDVGFINKSGSPKPSV